MGWSLGGTSFCAKKKKYFAEKDRRDFWQKSKKVLANARMGEGKRRVVQ